MGKPFAGFSAPFNRVPGPIICQFPPWDDSPVAIIPGIRVRKKETGKGIGQVANPRPSGLFLASVTPIDYIFPLYRFPICARVNKARPVHAGQETCVDHPASISPSPTPTSFPNRSGRPPGSKTGAKNPFYTALERQARIQSGARTSALSDPLLSLKEVQLLLGISGSTARKLIKSGMLQFTRTTGSLGRGHLRVRLSWAVRFMEAKNAGQ